jgi:hypothetical protein
VRASELARRLVNRVLGTRRYTIRKHRPGAYDQDGLWSVHNHDFMRDPAFVRAYARGAAAAGQDYGWHWRIHVGLWAARTASALPGDFVECGVNYGFMSSAIMADLGWDGLGKIFYLLDTFQGFDERYVSPPEIAAGALKRNRQALASGFYTSRVETVRANFAEWKHVRIVEGPIPDTLVGVDAERVAYLHLDMNCAPPEVAALEFFWERLVPGALVLLDDYAYRGHETQKAALDQVATARGVGIASLPTGQGLLVRPPRTR